MQGAYQPVISMMQSVHQLADDVLHFTAGPCRMHAVLQGCIQKQNCQWMTENTEPTELDSVFSGFVCALNQDNEVLEEAYFARASPLARRGTAQQLP